MIRNFCHIVNVFLVLVAFPLQVIAIGIDQVTPPPGEVSPCPPPQMIYPSEMPPPESDPADYPKSPKLEEKIAQMISSGRCEMIRHYEGPYLAILTFQMLCGKCTMTEYYLSQGYPRCPDGVMKYDDFVLFDWKLKLRDETISNWCYTIKESEDLYMQSNVVLCGDCNSCVSLVQTKNTYHYTQSFISCKEPKPDAAAGEPQQIVYNPLQKTRKRVFDTVINDGCQSVLTHLKTKEDIVYKSKCAPTIPPQLEGRATPATLAPDQLNPITPVWVGPTPTPEPQWGD